MLFRSGDLPLHPFLRKVCSCKEPRESPGQGGSAEQWMPRRGCPQQRWSCTVHKWFTGKRGSSRRAPPGRWRPALEPGRDQKGRRGFSCLFCARCLPEHGSAPPGEGRKAAGSHAGCAGRSTAGAVGVAWWGAQLVRGPTERLHRGRRNGKTASLNPRAPGAVGRQEGGKAGRAEPEVSRCLWPRRGRRASVQAGSWAGGRQTPWGWTKLQ